MFLKWVSVPFAFLSLLSAPDDSACNMSSMHRNSDTSQVQHYQHAGVT